MNNYTTTVFLDSRLHVRGNSSIPPVLYVEPDGEHRSACITFQIDHRIPAAEQLKVAERFAKGVDAWRAGIAARVEQERTAADELAEARAEIARLKGEGGVV